MKCVAKIRRKRRYSAFSRQIVSNDGNSAWQRRSWMSWRQKDGPFDEYRGKIDYFMTVEGASGESLKRGADVSRRLYYRNYPVERHAFLSGWAFNMLEPVVRGSKGTQLAPCARLKIFLRLFPSKRTSSDFWIPPFHVAL